MKIKHTIRAMAALTVMFAATPAHAIMASQPLNEKDSFRLASADPVMGPGLAPADNQPSFIDVIAANPGKEVIDGNGIFNMVPGAGTLMNVDFRNKTLIYSQAGALLLDSGWMGFPAIQYDTATTTFDSAGGDGGLATATGYPNGLLVEGLNYTLRDVATGAPANTLQVRVFDPAVGTPVWSKTFTDNPLYGNLDLPRCEVTDVDGDGTDDIVITFFKQTGATTAKVTRGVLNIVTGALKSSIVYNVQ